MNTRFELTAKRSKSRKPTRKSKWARKLAYATGGIGTAVLGLSVTHCTESICLLTGSHWLLSGLLAIGIDTGMVASELAEMTRVKGVERWARGYTIAAVLLSVLLNAYAFGLHASDGMIWASWLLGACIPGLVYALGRIAGILHQAS